MVTVRRSNDTVTIEDTKERCNVSIDMTNVVAKGVGEAIERAAYSMYDTTIEVDVDGKQRTQVQDGSGNQT